MGEAQVSGGQIRPYREFGAWLKSRRLARRMSQADLAESMAYDVSYVRKVEWGTRRPSRPFVVRIAEVFDLPVDAVPSPDFGEAGPQLPVPSTTFIGRADDVESVAALLESNRMVTLVGAPGIGKTRLAIELAKVFEARLEHGSRFVALDSVADASDVPAATARALGLAASARSSEQAVIDDLRRRQLLIVFDNFEHVLDARSFVRDLLGAAPGVRVLATSREPLHLSGEVRYPLPPLRFPDAGAFPAPAPAVLAEWPAVALFLARARLVEPEFSITADNARTVAALCAALDGVPLAIELTASAIRLFSPEALLDRLHHALDFPVSAPRDVAVRQQSIAAAIDSSFERLSDDERTVFSRSSVFVGGFAIDAAAAVCADADADADADGGLDPARVRAVVASLAEKSLIGTRTGPGGVGGVRFSQLGLVRQYTVDKLAGRGESDGLRRRHAEYYAAWVESVEPQLTGADQVRRLAELDEEGANLRAGIAWAMGHEPVVALRICGATWRWWMRRNVSEGRELFRAVLAAAAPLESIDVQRSRLKALNGAGVLSATLGEHDVALAFLGPAKAMAEDLERDGDLAVAHVHLGLVAEACGDYADAFAHFEAAATLYRAVPDARGLAHAVNALATVAVDTGDHERALGLYEQSLDAFRRLGDRWSEAIVTANLGWTALALDQPIRARSWYDQSLSAWRSVKDDRGVATVLAGLGRAGHQLAEPPSEIIGRLEEALLLFVKVGDRRGVAECLEELAGVAVDAEDWTRAGTLLSAAAVQRRIAGATQSPDERVRVDRLLDDVRAHLDADPFEIATAHGASVGLEEAVTFALCRSPIAPGT